MRHQRTEFLIFFSRESRMSREYERGQEPRQGSDRRVFLLGAALLSLRRPVSKKGSCVLFHIKCPECGSLIVKAGTPTAADADSEFDKAIADIKLLGATPDPEPTSSKEQVELFCLNGHKLALEEIGRQIVEQCDAVEARRLRRAQSPALPTSVMRP
jgi:hypothetical protein